MSDLSITAANVVQLTGTPTSGIAGAAITAGQEVYIDPTTQHYLLAKANSATVAAQSASGIAMTSAAIGQPIFVATWGTYIVGATVTVGGVYVLSGANAGGIAPIADLTSGWFTQIALIGITSTTAKIVNIGAGVAVP
jgi:hypothetical protein